MVELKNTSRSERIEGSFVVWLLSISLEEGTSTSTRIVIRYVGTSTFGSFGYFALFVEFSTPPSGRKWKFCLAAQNC